MNNFKTNRFIISKEGWGAAKIEDVALVLNSSIELFENYISSNRFNKKSILIQNTKFHVPVINHPIIYKREPENLIFLHVEGRYWSKYSYQFSHEYCHHQINSNFINSHDQFGWFEESICELASIQSIYYMSEKWKFNPPYPNWKSYSKHLKEYANKIVDSKENKISIPLSEWIKDNINELGENRYLRTKNRLVATNLVSIFTDLPQLWDSITYLKEVTVTKNMQFVEFINAWEKQIPPSGKTSWIKLKKELIN